MKGFYINLDNRTDRREHFENISPIFKDIERFPAIDYYPGYIGCAMSHIAVLKKGLDIEGEYIYVFEDDFMILNMNNFANFLNDFETIDVDWDVIVLTPRGTTINPNSNSKFRSNSPERMHLNGITGLLYRAHKICSTPADLQGELRLIDNTFIANGYPWPPQKVDFIRNS